ncbi:uncharacterized protein LOC123870486 [Maniola jurtina]|uniref:uncharacterized protein LOC123870486 n=1 Tax=Maniola jurtina TaxID=191418 RepID=UPI001E68CE0B|nr:uncharacterized protein LOC123870486 [Maniola jurtina]
MPELSQVELLDRINKSLKFLPNFDGNSHTLTRFINLADELVRSFLNPAQEYDLSNLSLISGILNKITGSAARTISANGISDDWNKIKATLINSFSDYRDEIALITDLTYLIQGSDTVQIFYEKVQNLLCTLITYVELHDTVKTTVDVKRTLYQKLALKTFLKGLREPLGSRVRCMRPPTLQTALEFAKEELNIIHLQNRTKFFQNYYKHTRRPYSFYSQRNYYSDTKFPSRSRRHPMSQKHIPSEPQYPSSTYIPCQPYPVPQNCSQVELNQLEILETKIPVNYYKSDQHYNSQENMSTRCENEIDTAADDKQNYEFILSRLPIDQLNVEEATNLINLAKEYSDVFYVEKENLTQEFRQVNFCTMENSYPISNLTDVLDKLGRCLYFTTLGLNLNNETFQNFIDNYLQGLPNSIVYLSKILVFSTSLQEHIMNFRAILERLRKAECPKVNSSKLCEQKISLTEEPTYPENTSTKIMLLQKIDDTLRESNSTITP